MFGISQLLLRSHEAQVDAAHGETLQKLRGRLKNDGFRAAPETSGRTHFRSQGRVSSGNGNEDLRDSGKCLPEAPAI